MKKRSIILIILALVVVSGAFYYFAAVYVSPEKLMAKRAALSEELEQKKETLAVIESYLSAREEGEVKESALSEMQNMILSADSLVTASKTDLETFDLEVKALRTIISMELDEINEQLGK